MNAPHVNPVRSSWSYLREEKGKNNHQQPGSPRNGKRIQPLRTTPKVPRTLREFPFNQNNRGGTKPRFPQQNKGNLRPHN